MTEKQPEKTVRQVIYFYAFNTWETSHKGQLQRKEYNPGNWL